MPNAFQVRSFVSSDAPSVLALWSAALPSSQPWNEPLGVLCRKRNRSDDLIFVAEWDKQIVGAVMAGYDGVRGWIYSLAVSPDHRSQGIGAALMAHSEQSLARLGCLKVNLQVRSDNADVISFYQKCGFAQEDRASLGKPLGDRQSPASGLIPRIEISNKITLTPIKLSDRSALIKHLNETNEFHLRTATLPFPYTGFDADQWLTKTVLEPAVQGLHGADPQAFHWAIRNQDEMLLGTVGLMNATAGEKAELGYWLAKPFWGRGIMTDVVCTLCKESFDRFSLQRIHARVFADNKSSANVLAKAGFEREGVLRNDYFKDGQPIDVFIFGLLRDDVSKDATLNRESVSFGVDDKPTKDEIAFIDDQIESFNAEQTGRDDKQPIHLVIRDRDGHPIAGLNGLTTLDWLYVGTLWVNPKHRQLGFGSKLLRLAEATAVERGCTGACLSSFTFQAPDFYQSHGYDPCGEIEDYPEGGSLLFFKKRF